MDLDGLYGECRPAGDTVHDHEAKFSPLSLMKLCTQNADVVCSFFNTQQTVEIVNSVPISCHVLWVINRSGDIYLSLEELIDENGKTVGVLSKEILSRLGKPILKLGHPSLLGDDKEARIAGEIKYDPDIAGDGKRLWCINNESGRYGIRPWQTKEHLQAACRYFETFGLYFSENFLKPTRR